jgi:hypothetical protein
MGHGVHVGLPEPDVLQVRQAWRSAALRPSPAVSLPGGAGADRLRPWDPRTVAQLQRLAGNAATLNELGRSRASVQRCGHHACPPEGCSPAAADEPTQPADRAEPGQVIQRMWRQRHPDSARSTMSLQRQTDDEWQLGGGDSGGAGSEWTGGGSTATGAQAPAADGSGAGSQWAAAAPAAGTSSAGAQWTGGAGADGSSAGSQWTAGPGASGSTETSDATHEGASDIWDRVNEAVAGSDASSDYHNPFLPWPSKDHPTQHYLTDNVVSEDWMIEHGYVLQSTEMYKKDPPHYQQIWKNTETGDVVYRYVKDRSSDEGDEGESPKEVPPPEDDDLQEARDTLAHVKGWWSSLQDLAEEARHRQRAADYPQRHCQVYQSLSGFSGAVTRAHDRSRDWSVRPEHQSELDNIGSDLDDWFKRVDSGEHAKEIWTDLPSPRNPDGSFVRCADLGIEIEDVPVPEHPSEQEEEE